MGHVLHLLIQNELDLNQKRKYIQSKLKLLPYLQDMISNIKNILQLKSYVPMHPFYRKFKGNIIQNGNTNYRTSGKYEFIPKDCIHITELPLNLWTDKFKEHLETLIIDPKVTNKKLLNKQFIKYYESQCSDDTIDFKIYYNKNNLHIK